MQKLFLVVLAFNAAAWTGAEVPPAPANLAAKCPCASDECIDACTPAQSCDPTNPASLVANCFGYVACQVLQEGGPMYKECETTTKYPTKFPTSFPSAFPSSSAETSTKWPTRFPTRFPSSFPSTGYPSSFPTTAFPTAFPVTTKAPSHYPSKFPTASTGFPSTGFPTTSFPTSFPSTAYPTAFPVRAPSRFPTEATAPTSEEEEGTCRANAWGMNCDGMIAQDPKLYTCEHLEGGGGGVDFDCAGCAGCTPRVCVGAGGAVRVLAPSGAAAASYVISGSGAFFRPSASSGTFTKSSELPGGFTCSQGAAAVLCFDFGGGDLTVGANGLLLGSFSSWGAGDTLAGVLLGANDDRATFVGACPKPGQTPTKYPTAFPTSARTGFPSAWPTGFPTTTGFPTRATTTRNPTTFPTGFPSTGYPSTRYPSSFPSSFYPTAFPSTGYPSAFPSRAPTHYPIPAPPTREPTTLATTRPSQYPSKPPKLTAAPTSDEDLVGIIPRCADTGGTPPCVPALDGSAPCPNVAATIAGDFATEVLRSCGIASSAVELVMVGNLRGDDAKALFFQIVCDAASAPIAEPACATNLAMMGLAFHACECSPTDIICSIIARPLYLDLQPLVAACESGDKATAACAAAACAGVRDDFMASAFCAGTTASTCPAAPPTDAPTTGTPTTAFPTRMPTTPFPTRTPTEAWLEYTKAAVARHSAEDDCWVIIGGFIYEVTRVDDYGDYGGSPGVGLCGGDATDAHRAGLLQDDTLSPVGTLKTKAPTPFPTRRPTKFPTAFPSRTPTKFPTAFPTRAPSPFPSTKRPTVFPSRFPTTKSPTKYPVTRFPTKFPVTRYPTKFPTRD